MYLEIVSPESVLYQGEVDSVKLPGNLGEFEILRNHTPIISTLSHGEVILKNSTSTNDRFDKNFSKNSQGNEQLSILSGTVEVENNKITITAEI